MGRKERACPTFHVSPLANNVFNSAVFGQARAMSAAASQKAMITQLKSIVAQQKQEMEVLATRLEQQTFQIEKMPARLEPHRKSLSTTVKNNEHYILIWNSEFDETPPLV
jgi:hypothetical protein